MTAPRTFDAATMPLRGLHLIEASAGTGKTYSLAGLYLRLLLEEQLTPRDILVMTFTRAATQELRERIRTRLAQAAAIAAHGLDDDAHDAQFAEQLVQAAVARGEDRASVTRRLVQAAATMDEATITTIHGFSQRAVAENAFDSGLPFDRGEQVDDNSLWLEAARDYWRARTVNQPRDTVMAFTACWPGPASLYAELDPLLRKPASQLRLADAEHIAQLAKQARNAWETDAGKLAALLEQAVDAGSFLGDSGLLKEINLPGNSVADMLDALRQGLFSQPDKPPLLPEWVQYLGDADSVAAQVRKRPDQSWFDPHLLPLCQVLAPLRRMARGSALVDALRWVEGETLARKRARRQFSFNDMIMALHEAVHDPRIGPALSDALHRTWPWALVDEFQDTDPSQYDILRCIYARERERPGGLIMIGDPKQAIYRFRGGDVHAYLRAGHDADDCFTLPRNFRSTPAVLDAIEALFRQGGEQAFVIDGIRFHTVEPGRASGDRVYSIGTEPLPAMTVWTLPDREDGKPWPGNAAKPRLLHACIKTIADLLHGPGAGEVHCADGECRPIAPADIGILVNSNREATEVQAALAVHGIPAVCLHQDSVFDSRQAGELLQLLQAVANPLDEGLVRAALTCELFAHSMADLIALREEEDAWRAVIEEFQSAHERWHRNGPLDMLQPWLQGAAARLLGWSDGERRMTNWLHLADSLEGAAAESFGMAGLIRWLEETMTTPADAESADARQLRLESDEDLVRISTVHKAKGLQYPVVFLPYAALLGSSGKPDVAPYFYHDHQGTPMVALSEQDDSAARRSAIQEQRAEAMRLLYVALTRAEQALYLSWAPVGGAPDSALALLLHGTDGADAGAWGGKRKAPAWVSAETLGQRLEELEQRAPHAIQVNRLSPEPAAMQSMQPAQAELDRGARDDFPAPRQPWRVFSFSGLVSHASARPEPDQGAEDESHQSGETDPWGVEAEVMVSPAGPAFGTAVHDMLEELDFQSWPLPEPAMQPWIVERLRRHGLVVPDGADGKRLVDNIRRLLDATLTTALPGIGPLQAVEPQHRRSELEFFLRLGGTNARAVTDCLAAHGYAINLAAERREQLLNGLMHGFIDLTVEADGRYWIIDYKTNLLGARRQDYAAPQLGIAVRAGHYDLQYLIYLVALHRYLQRGLPGYTPEQHLGGAQYLFVRGMNGINADEGVFVDRPPDALILELDALFDGGAAQ